jgi:8-oxo-dGTP pyrophosphatase MutT (NUDIX family)
MITEITYYGGQRAKLTWVSNGRLPPLITQVSGYCFNLERKILIAQNQKGHWVFPGGHPKKGEEPLATLRREILEETGVMVEDNPIYLGYQQVEFLAKPYPKDGKLHYQIRYFCRPKKIEKFIPKFETKARKFVDLTQLEKYIPWINGKAASSQIRLAKSFLSRNLL